MLANIRTLIFGGLLVSGAFVGQGSPGLFSVVYFSVFIPLLAWVPTLCVDTADVEERDGRGVMQHTFVCLHGEMFSLMFSSSMCTPAVRYRPLVCLVMRP